MTSDKPWTPLIITHIAVLTLMHLDGVWLSSDHLREHRLFSVFNVIRFQNLPCQSLDNNLEGVCYTSDECLARRGSVSGSCASGFGVCCLFQVGCGATVRENCTYFSSSVRPVGAGFCDAQVCQIHPDICQLRLDLLDFSIAGPSTSTAVAGFLLNGNLIENTQGPGVTTASRCIADRFMVTNPGGTSPPTICGQNSGEHLYVDVSEGCNDLSFFIDEASVSAATGTSVSWMIKISQLACDFPHLAPSGCTQWFFGSNAGVVKTFNYESGTHLADQHQTICVRRELDTCSICWTPEDPTDFQVSGVGNMGITDPDICCGFGFAGVDIRGFDCLVIPQARTKTNLKLIPANRFCGASRGLALMGSQTVKMVPPVPMGLSVPGTICSSRTPFGIRFISDNFEYSMEIRPQKGFRLLYELSPCV